MKVSASTPDALPPGVRALIYGAFCWLNRHTFVLRGIGALLRRWPFVGGWFGLAVRARAVKDVLTRTRSFSNRSHAANLVSGNYLIAMDPGPTYAADKALLDDRLAALQLQFHPDREAQRRLESVRKAEREARQAGKTAAFDLIDDYLMWIVFRAIEPVFGTAAGKLAVGPQGDVTDEGLQRQYLLDVRYVAGQLLAGGLSTLPFQRRAELSADSLRARIESVISDIQQSWNASGPPDMIERNAIGLAWISHPVTVQSGALVVQELLGRPKIYRALRSEAEKIGEPRIWTDADFRKSVRDHVLELMRFRPIFPLLARDVPRDTEFETGAQRNARCLAGGKVAVWSIAALFDPSVVADSGKFCPHRDWSNEEPLRWLMFGYGDRQCPAKDYAVEIITSALIGMLILPELRLARGKGKAITYEGPLMSRMCVQFAPQEK